MRNINKNVRGRIINTQLNYSHIMRSATNRICQLTSRGFAITHLPIFQYTNISETKSHPFCPAPAAPSGFKPMELKRR